MKNRFKTICARYQKETMSLILNTMSNRDSWHFFCDSINYRKKKSDRQRRKKMNGTIDRDIEYALPSASEKDRLGIHNQALTGLNKYKNILIVDDNESIIELLSILLLDEGAVSTAINGVDALSKFAGKSFDLIISDIEMPLMNGIELYQYVTRINPKYKDRFLFFSATMNEKFTDYLERNNLMLLRKPEDILKLYSFVQKIL